MRELLRTTDAVLLSYVSSVLTDCDIGFAILDRNMSMLEASIDILPQRLMVSDSDYDEAVKLCEELGVAPVAAPVAAEPPQPGLLADWFGGWRKLLPAR